MKRAQKNFERDPRKKIFLRAKPYGLAAPGMRGRTGVIRTGQPAALVVLSGDPLAEPGVWRVPMAVIADGRLIGNGDS